MEKEASGDTSGSGGDGRAAQDSAQSVSGVTETGTSGNAGEKARRRHHGVAGGEDDDGLLAVVDRAVGDGGGVEWEVGEVTTADGDGDEAAASSPVAARLGWLLLGFLAGAAVAAAVLFLMRDEVPVTCTVVPT